MSLVKHSDHLSPHHRKGIHLAPPPSQPDATGFSVEEPARPDSEVEEQRQQPSPSGLEAPSLVALPDSGHTVVPKISKGAEG